MSVEVWKDVVGYEDRYQVSNIGRVRSKEFRSVVVIYVTVVTENGKQQVV